MEASDLVHEESSHIAKRLARRAHAEGKNVIWDITMSSRESTYKADRRASAHSVIRVEGIFIDIPVDIGVSRADGRHREGQDTAGQGLGGRFVPAEMIRVQADSEWGSRNRKTFEEVKAHLDRWLL